MRNGMKIGTAAAAVLLALSVAGCAKSTPSPSTTAGPTATTPAPTGTATTGVGAGAGTAAAQAVYKQNCMTCHGADLSGGVGPNLQTVGGRLSGDQIRNRISNGGGGMPAFKGTLSDDQINALVQWLSAKK